MQPGTLPRAGILGAAILGTVAAFAWFGFSGSTPAPIDRYLRQGPAAGAAALRRELMPISPPGLPVAPLVRRLQDLGMGCSLGASPGAEWVCAIAVPAEARRRLRLQVTIATRGEAIATLETGILEPPP